MIANGQESIGNMKNPQGFPYMPIYRGENIEPLKTEGKKIIKIKKITKIVKKTISKYQLNWKKIYINFFLGWLILLISLFTLIFVCRLAFLII